MKKQTKFIIKEHFKSNTTEERQKNLEEIFFQLIKKHLN